MSPEVTSPSGPKPVADLAKRLGYEFKDARLLELACIHKSYGNEHRSSEPVSVRDNERFEFLGDAVLDLIVSQILLEAFPDCSEGDLSKLRASLVNEKSLARIARALALGDFLLLGKGEQHTGGRDKDSILASTFEAVVAAVYSDGGFSTCNEWVRGLFAERVKLCRDQSALQDFKTRLQEVVQARFKNAPRYEVLNSSGPDHDKTFEIQLLINGDVLAGASGKSKKEAEQSAAKIALEKLEAKLEAKLDPKLEAKLDTK
ncbi:MAG: ribonuclease III [Deltaproteobacteria bacterium]|nr:ribonuclease III [Deltaproteobacteria bacterium]